MTAVHWEERAIEALVELASRDRRQAARLIVAIYRVARGGEGDVRKLTGVGEQWRLRVGDWRVLFARDDDDSMQILSVVPRRDAYR